MKTYNMTIKWEEDPEWGEDVPRCELLSDPNGNQVYSVHSLADCPEDACIPRDLVSAWEIVDYIKFGMALTAEGYTDVSVTDEKVDSIY